MSEIKSSHQFTFAKNPKEYCQALYREFWAHNDALREKIEENRKFYNGIDDYLEKRRANPKLKRSCVFVHAQRSAIDTGLSAIIDALEEGLNDTVKFIPSEGAEDQAPMIAEREALLNEILREDGFLSRGVQEMARESRIAPVVFIKVGYKVEYDIIHEIARGPVDMMRKVFEWTRYSLGISDVPPQDRVVHRWDVKYEGPYTEVKDWDEILYDHEAHDHQAGRAMIERAKYNKEEILALAAENDWDSGEIQRMFDDRAAKKDGSTSSTDDSVADKEREAMGVDAGAKYDQGKYLVCEFWIPVYGANGRKRMHRYFLGENEYVLSREKHGTPTYFTKYPFEALANNRRLNQIEGTPAVELTKPLQRLFNDLHNAINDNISYGGAFGIYITKQNNFTKTPQVKPAAVWEVNDIDQIRKESADSSAIPALITLLTVIGERIDTMHNAPDFGQAKNIGEGDEKVFQTKLRAMGSARRSRTDFKEIGQLVIAVAKWFVELYRMHDNVDWVFDAEVDVPALTGNYTPQEEQEKMYMVVQTAATTLQALYTTPMGRVKLRNLTEEWYRKLRLRDVDDILPKEEDMIVEDQVLALLTGLSEEANNQQTETPGVSGDSGETQGVQNAVV